MPRPHCHHRAPSTGHELHHVGVALLKSEARHDKPSCYEPASGKVLGLVRVVKRGVRKSQIVRGCGK